MRRSIRWVRARAEQCHVPRSWKPITWKFVDVQYLNYPNVLVRRNLLRIPNAHAQISWQKTGLIELHKRRYLNFMRMRRVVDELVGASLVWVRVIVDPHHSGSASLWCGSRCGSEYDLSPWCLSGCGSEFWFFFDVDPDPTFNSNADPDLDPVQILASKKAQTLEKC